MIGMSNADFWRPENARRFREAELEVMRTGTPVIDKITRYPVDGGPDARSSSMKPPLRDADGTITGIIRLAHDISELMNAQEALRDSESQRKGLMRQVLTVQEEERARIARELHDQVGQDLASVLVGLRVIESAETAEAAQRQAVTLRDRTANTLEDVRKIAIANAARHANAENVGIVLCLSDGVASVIVEDDGRGFDVEAVLSGPVDQPFALLAMQERMQMLGGEITVDSTPGEEAVIFIELNPD